MDKLQFFSMEVNCDISPVRWVICKLQLVNLLLEGDIPFKKLPFVHLTPGLLTVTLQMPFDKLKENMY